MTSHLDDLTQMLFSRLATLQDRLGSEGGHTWFLPKIAASHFAAHLATSKWSNECGLHAVSLGTARQAFESLSIIELGTVGEPGRQQLQRWEQGLMTAGNIRKWLQLNSWPSFPPGPRGATWIEFMSGLGRALQPYAHFSPELLQWNMNMVRGPGPTGQALVAIGPGSYDPNRAARVQLLRGALTLALATIMTQADPGCLQGAEVEAVHRLRVDVDESEWLISSHWQEVLTPHVWDVH
ncbi:MAG: hypothetical protein V9G08_03225 [Dermatophilaceae bacterium]